MGKTLLVGRLGGKDLRGRPVQALLLLVVITAAMTALTLGLLLREVTSRPYAQTRAASAGPDVVASSVGYTGQSAQISPAALSRFAALAHAPGVTAHSGPYPVAWPVLQAGGMTADVMGRAWLVKASAWLPVPLLLATRVAGRRPRRTLLSAASFTVTATAIVAVLDYHATLGHDTVLAGPFAGPPDPMRGRISAVLLVVTIMMATLAAANTVFTTWATVLDSRHFSAIVRSLGATPGQSVVGLSATQLLPALAGALLGIPAGTELYAAVQGAGPRGTPPAWWLLAMVLGMLLAAAGLTAIPARAGTRRPTAEILQAETA